MEASVSYQRTATRTQTRKTLSLRESISTRRMTMKRSTTMDTIKITRQWVTGMASLTSRTSADAHEIKLLGTRLRWTLEVSTTRRETKTRKATKTTRMGLERA